MDVKEKKRRRSLRILHCPVPSVTTGSDDFEELCGDTDSKVYGTLGISDTGNEDCHTVYSNSKQRDGLDKELINSDLLRCCVSPHQAVSSDQHVFNNPQLVYCVQQPSKHLSDIQDDHISGQANRPFLDNEICFGHPDICPGDTMSSCKSRGKASEEQRSSLVHLSNSTPLLDSSVSKAESQRWHSINMDEIPYMNTGMLHSSHSEGTQKLLGTTESNPSAGIIPFSTSCSTVTYDPTFSCASSNQEVDVSICDLRHNRKESAFIGGVNNSADWNLKSGIEAQEDSGNAVKFPIDTNSDGPTTGNQSPSTYHHNDTTGQLKVSVNVNNCEYTDSVKFYPKRLAFAVSDNHNVRISEQDRETADTEITAVNVNNCTELNSVTGETYVSAASNDVFPDHQEHLLDSNQKPDIARLSHGKNKQQDAKIRKLRRRSAFGKEFKVGFFAHQEGTINDRLYQNTGTIQEFPDQKSTCLNCPSVSPCVCESVSNHFEHDDKVQPTMAEATDNGLQTKTEQESLEDTGLEGKCGQESALNQQVQTVVPLKRRKRRMSADTSIIVSDMEAGSSLGCPDLAQDDGDSVVSVFPKRRSSLRLYRRQSHKFAVSSRTNGENESCSGQKTCSDDFIDESTKPVGQLSVQPSCADDATSSGELDCTGISSELESLYHNKNYKKPADKTWETIFESPSKGKIISKQKLKRYLQFEDNIPVSKLKRRLKKAAQNGWDVSGKKQKQTSDEEVKFRLKQLDEEMSV